MSLISAALKTEMTNAMAEIFSAFKRDQPITFYKTANNTVVAHDPDFNADFDFQSTNSQITSTSQSQSFYCRVWPEERQEMNNIVDGPDDMGIHGKFFYNRIRVQFEPDAFLYLKDTERFIWYDEKYALMEGWKRIGIADSNQFYEIVLRRVNLYGQTPPQHRPPTPTNC